MRASRLLSILIMLQGEGRLTAQALAERFEVSKRTIYRDLDELSAAGIPVSADRGVGGGIGLKGSYRTELTGLTAEEAAAFALCSLPDLAAQLGIAGAAAGARAKITDAIAGPAPGLVGKFHLDPADWYGRIALPPHLRALAEAVRHDRRVRIDYESWTARKEREVDPMGLIVKANSWYLLARRKGRFAIYKVDNIRGIEVEATRFNRPRDFDLAAEWCACVARFEKELFDEEAEVRVAPAAVSRLGRLGAGAKEALLAAAPDADGYRSARIPIENGEAFVREALGFAGELEVLGPASLKARYRATLEAMLAA